MRIFVDTEAFEVIRIGLGDRLIDSRAWAAMPDASQGTRDRLAAAERAAEQIRQAQKPFPRVVVLCGSTKFKEEFEQINREETLAGNLVISVGVFRHTDMPDYDWESEEGQTRKTMLDVLHKRKIDLGDEIFVINVGGYIGSSTRSEIDYARSKGKVVRYLEDPVKSSWMESER